jgi:hypothetical protein
LSWLGVFAEHVLCDCSGLWKFEELSSCVTMFTSDKEKKNRAS